MTENDNMLLIKKLSWEGRDRRRLIIAECTTIIIVRILEYFF